MQYLWRFFLIIVFSEMVCSLALIIERLQRLLCGVIASWLSLFPIHIVVGERVVARAMVFFPTVLDSYLVCSVARLSD